jgi:hypothetical protein
MKSYWAIFAVAFVTSIIIVPLYRAFIASILGEWGLFVFYIVASICFVIYPILVFTVFYFLGKRINLSLELRPILIALFVGAFAGRLVGSCAEVFWLNPLRNVTFGGALISVAYVSVFAGFFGEAFVALAGLFIANLKKNRVASEAYAQSN